MVLAYHAVFTTYGFWLPNDPRGSWSDYVASWELFRFGPATKTSTRRSVAREKHDWSARVNAKNALKYPPVSFDGSQARAIGQGFADAAAEDRIVIRACAILPEHVHVVLARHKESIEWMVKRLKRAGTRALLAERQHPLAAFADDDGNVPMVWARGRWKVFLDSPDGVERAIRYVEDNPLKEEKRRQRWPFVTSFRETV